MTANRRADGKGPRRRFIRKDIKVVAVWLVGSQMVGQEVTGFLGTHATWVLEFYYRSRDQRSTVDLLAGVSDPERSA